MKNIKIIKRQTRENVEPPAIAAPETTPDAANSAAMRPPSSPAGSAIGAGERKPTRTRLSTIYLNLTGFR